MKIEANFRASRIAPINKDSKNEYLKNFLKGKIEKIIHNLNSKKVAQNYGIKR